MLRGDTVAVPETGGISRVRAFTLGNRYRLLRPLLLCVVLLGATPVLADPVGECQASTGNQADTGQCLNDTLSAAQHVLSLELTRAQERADSID